MSTEVEINAQVPESKPANPVTESPKAAGLTRRQLMQGASVLALLGVASKAEADCGNGCDDTSYHGPIQNECCIEEPVDPFSCNLSSAPTLSNFAAVRNDGRHVLLERLINHKFCVADGTNQAQLCDDPDDFAVFDSRQEHQAWLFGEKFQLDPSNPDSYCDFYEAKGLAHYAKVTFSTMPEDDAVKAPVQYRYVGADFSNAADQYDNSRFGLTTMLQHAKRRDAQGGLDVFQLGHAIGDAYDQQDIYGLLKLKFEWLAGKCVCDGVLQALEILSASGRLGDTSVDELLESLKSPDSPEGKALAAVRSQMNETASENTEAAMERRRKINELCTLEMFAAFEDGGY